MAAHLVLRRTEDGWVARRDNDSAAGVGYVANIRLGFHFIALGCYVSVNADFRCRVRRPAPR
jgi:hypothetical protein